jgi:hypothetical protein
LRRIESEAGKSRDDDEEYEEEEEEEDEEEEYPDQGQSLPSWVPRPTRFGHAVDFGAA